MLAARPGQSGVRTTHGHRDWGRNWTQGLDQTAHEAIEEIREFFAE